MCNSDIRPDIPILLPYAFPVEKSLASDPPSDYVQVTYNYYAEPQEISKAFYLTVFKKDATAWHQWICFCSWMHITPDLQGIKDPIPFLHIITKRVRASLLSAKGKPIKKLFVGKYLRSIVKIFVSMGDNDPQNNCMEK